MRRLIAALGDSDRDVRQEADRALTELAARAASAVRPYFDQLARAGAAEPLIVALRGGEPGAALALAKLGDARAVEALIAALGDSDRDVRQQADRALTGLAARRASHLT